jgi:hypothetical protein
VVVARPTSKTLPHYDGGVSSRTPGVFREPVGKAVEPALRTTSRSALE